MSGTIYADLRCLQDANYRVRGIGRHVAALMRARERSLFSSWKMVGLLDPAWPELPPECASLVEEVTYSVNPSIGEASAVFIDWTPMTHDLRFNLRFQNHPAFFRAAVVYDFIPLDWPGYLPNLADRIYFISKLARLKTFDLYCPISEYTAWRLAELLGVPQDRIRVTGASVRQSVYELRERLRVAPSPNGAEKEPYLVMVTATDSRKNPEVAVQAVRRLNLLYGGCIRLKIIGHYDYSDAYKASLFRMAGHKKGAGFLEFCPAIPDEELVALLAGAMATVVPSHIEGFSLPVVEAAVCGCPVVASSCAAHLELVEQPEALFPSHDPVALSERLEALLNDADLRARLVAEQAGLGAKFHEDLVGKRFWAALEGSVGKRGPAVTLVEGKKRTLAFFSPYPPDESAAASYTAMAMKAGKGLFQADLFSDSKRPLEFEGVFRDACGTSAAAFLDKRYDAILSVLGNCSSCIRGLEIFERFGGPCILHDVGFAQIYFERFGPDEFPKFAGHLLGRSVSKEEVQSWLEQRVQPPSLFLERVIQRASPLMVHSATQQALLKKQYGVHAHLLPCCPTVHFDSEDLAADNRRDTRERLGISPDAFLIASFGAVSKANGADSSILAVELLRSWKIPAELYFAGNADSYEREVERIARLFDVAERVHYGGGLQGEAAQRDFLIGADAAVQLQTHGFGKPPREVTNCVSAALPAVATHDAAKSCEAPSFVSVVPDKFSPLQVAEQLATIWEAQIERDSLGGARNAYLRTHNFDVYAERLVEILGIA